MSHPGPHSWSVLLGMVAGAAAVPIARRAASAGLTRAVGPEITAGNAEMAYHLLTPERLGTFLENFEPRLARWLTPADRDRIVAAARQATTELRYGALGADDLDRAVRYMYDQRGGAALLDLGTAAEAVAHLGARATGPTIEVAVENTDAYDPVDPPPGPIRTLPCFDHAGGALVTFPSHYPRRWRGHLGLIDGITQGGTAVVVVRNDAWLRIAYRMIERFATDLDRVRFLTAPYDDMWIRDCGPEFVDTPTGIHGISHAYLPNGLGFHPRDSEIGTVTAQRLGAPVHRLPLVLDGGHIKPVAPDTAFVSTDLVRHNPDHDQVGIDDTLRRWLGYDRIIPVEPLPGETTGHVDLSIRPVNEQTVVVGRAPVGHRWHRALDSIAAQLARTESPSGGAFQVVRLDQPANPPRLAEWTYVNALTVGDVVVMPGYRPDQEDEGARRVLAEAFHGRTVVTAPCTDLPIGAVHCLTKEIPAALLS